MIISLPFDGPQNLLTFDIATTLPVNKLTGLGTRLTLKSNTIYFDDEDDNTIMQVEPSYVAILRDLDMAYRSIVSVFDIYATGAIFSQSLETDTIYQLNDNILFSSRTNFTLLDIGFNGGIQAWRDIYLK